METENIAAAIRALDVDPATRNKVAVHFAKAIAATTRWGFDVPSFIHACLTSPERIVV